MMLYWVSGSSAFRTISCCVPSAVTPRGNPWEKRHTSKDLSSVSDFMCGGLTHLSSIMGSVKDGVVDRDAAAGILGLHLPAHKGTCVLSMNTDNSDIPWT